MAIYRGEGGKTDVVPADGDQEFAGSIIAEKDIHAHGNISADGDLTIGGDIHWDGTITGDGSGLENVPTPFLQADDCIYLNNQVITSNYTMPVGKNGMTAGDITINGEVTIPETSDWHIIGNDDGLTTLESLGIPNHDLVTVDETGHLSTFGITSESPYVGDGSLLTGIPTPGDLGEIQREVDYNKANIETNAENIQTNADAIQVNADAIAAIPGAVDAYTKAEIDAQQSAQDVEIAKKANTDDTYTKTQTNTLLDSKANVGDSYTKSETYNNTEIDSKLYEKANKSNTYTKAEVDTSQSNQDTEIAKKADKDDTYTKDEVNELIETGSGAIVGNYKANYPVSVARDPEIGNLYLANAMAFTNNYDEVTTLYISIVDTDGTVRDLGKIVANDIIDLESANGSGSYTVQTISNVGTHYEIIVDRDNCNGTLAQDDDVKARLEVATVGIEEAPADGKTYGRKDEAWSEINTVTYTKAETNNLLDEKADKSDTYTKAEIDAQQVTQNDDIAQNTSDIVDLSREVDVLTGSVHYKGSLDATTVEAPADSLVGDMWINNYNVSEPDTNYPVASGWAPVTEIKYNDKLIKNDTGWDKIEAAQTPEGIEPIDAYTKDEVDASQKVQDDAIAQLQQKDAPWEPHDYLYVNNSVPSSEEDKIWETFVPPQPGEFFFLTNGGPVISDSYETVSSICISKFDKKGNELPFSGREEIYDNDGNLLTIRYDVRGNELKFASPNGSATYVMNQLLTSEVAPEHVDYEGETFFIIETDGHDKDFVYDGTIVEGETAQVTSPEEGYEVEWKEKEYESKALDGYPTPPVKFSSATIKNENILVNGLSIGSSNSMFGDRGLANIMIGNEPKASPPHGVTDYLPGLHWNAQDSGFGESERNIAIGGNALGACQTVSENTAIGFQSLPNLKEGWNNTALGFGAGANLTSGSNNTFIGHWAGPKGPDKENAQNQVVLGNGAEELWVGDNKVFPFPDDLGGGSGDSSGIEEAPITGRQYARQNETWTEVVGSIPEPPGSNLETWGRKLKTLGTNTYEWSRVKEAVAQWHNYKGEFFYGTEAPDHGGMAIDSLFYSSTNAIKISKKELPGTSVSTTPMADRLKSLKVGDSIDVQTTHYFKNSNHVGGGALEITGITEHDTHFEFAVKSNDKYGGSVELGDGIAILLPGEVAGEVTDTYDYNLEVNGDLDINGTLKVNGELISGGSASGDSHWTQNGNDLFYISPNTDSGLYLNSQEDNNVNIVGYNGTDACDLWLRAGGAPNTGVGVKDGGSLTTKGSADTNVNIEAPSGRYASFIADNVDQKWAMQIRPDQANSFVIREETNGFNALTIDTGGVVKLNTVNTNSNSTNMLNYIPATGAIERTNASFYNTEEVDKKLAIKDKLIEKLSARLDKLEKRVK